MIQIKGTIEFAFRDEQVNIWAMTKGGVNTKFGYQLLICKKKPFEENRLGPYILDCKKSITNFKLSHTGDQYAKDIHNKKLDLEYIGYIQEQIKIKPSIELFRVLQVEGVFSIWEPEAPVKYFEGCKEGYLILFRVYQLSSPINEALLEKGRSGRNFYYGLVEPVNFNNASPILENEQFNRIRQCIVDVIYKLEQEENIENKEREVYQIAEHSQKEVKITQYYRSSSIKRMVQQRANGICECCGNSAPFITDKGIPYLEEHHLVPLSEGGKDVLSNVFALCPNCHRELHFGQRKEFLKTMLS